MKLDCSVKLPRLRPYSEYNSAHAKHSAAKSSLFPVSLGLVLLSAFRQNYIYNLPDPISRRRRARIEMASTMRNRQTKPTAATKNKLWKIARLARPAAAVSVTVGLRRAGRLGLGRRHDSPSSLPPRS